MSINWRNAASGRRTLIPHNFFDELTTQPTSAACHHRIGPQPTRLAMKRGSPPKARR